MGPVPKAGYTDGLGGFMPVGNADVFPWDDGLLSFIAGGRVPCLIAILHVSFAKIVPFFCLGLQTIVFTLQLFSAILQFPHLPCLLLLFPLHLLTLMEELIFMRLMHQIV